MLMAVLYKNVYNNSNNNNRMWYGLNKAHSDLCVTHMMTSQWNGIGGGGQDHSMTQTGSAVRERLNAEAPLHEQKV